MPHALLRNFTATLLTLLLFPAIMMAGEENKSFYTITHQNGLSSNCVLQMLQLRDGHGLVYLHIMGQPISLPTEKTACG